MDFDLNLKKYLNMNKNNTQTQTIFSKKLDWKEQAQEFFDKILGLDGVKENVYLNLTAEENINTMLIGPPATAKSIFMEIIESKCNNVCYFDAAAGSSGAGLLDLLETHKNMKILIIDEVDKLKRSDQQVMLSFLQTGRVEKVLKDRKIKLKFEGVKVFATSNSTRKLSKPFISRFETYFLPEYSDEDFMAVIVHCLKNKFPEEISSTIAGCLMENEMKDVRLAISIAKKLKPKEMTPEDVIKVIQNKIDYSNTEDVDWN